MAIRDSSGDFPSRSATIFTLEVERRRIASGYSGGDDGTMPPNLEARVSSLESKVAEIASDMKAVAKDVAEIKGKISNQPTTIQIVSWFMGVSMGLVALVFAIAKR